MVGNMMRTQGGGFYNTINPGSKPSCNMTRPFVKGDEGNLDSIFGREVFIARVPVTATDVTGAQLFDESLGMRARAINDVSATWTTDVAYCDVFSPIFAKWQGTYEYTIYFAGSKFHKIPLMFAAIYGTSTKILTYEEVQYQSNGQVIMSADLPAIRVRVPFQSTFPELYTGEARDDIPDPLLTHNHVRFVMFTRGPLETAESVSDRIELIITKRFCGYVYHLTGENTSCVMAITPPTPLDEAVGCGPDRSDYTDPMPVATLDLQVPGPAKFFDDMGRTKDHTKGRENQRIHSLTEMYRRLRVKTSQWSNEYFFFGDYEIRATKISASELVGFTKLQFTNSRGDCSTSLFSAAMGGFHLSMVSRDITQRYWLAFYPGVGISDIKFENGRVHFPIQALQDFAAVANTLAWTCDGFDAAINGSVFTSQFEPQMTTGFAPIQPSHQGLATLHIPMTSNRMYDPLTPGVEVPNGWLVCLALKNSFPVIHIGGARDFQLGRFNGLRPRFAHISRSDTAALGIVTPSGVGFEQIEI
jgi:hypothetical protein